MLLCLMHVLCIFFFFKQKTAYEMRISDWSSDVCSSDLAITSRVIETDTDGGKIPIHRANPPRPPRPCSRRGSAPRQRALLRPRRRSARAPRTGAGCPSCPPPRRASPERRRPLLSNRPSPPPRKTVELGKAWYERVDDRCR